MKNLQPNRPWRSSAILMFALTLPSCGSDSDAPAAPFNTGAPPDNGAPPGEPAAPGDEAPPPGVPTSPNEGNPDDVMLGGGETPAQPGSPSDPAAQPGNPVPEGSNGTGFTGVETLDRGVVAVVQDGAVYVGWRMFGYEYDRETPARIAYNLYRDDNLVATVTDSTNFRDAAGTAASSYTVSVVIDGVEGPRSPAVTPWAENFLRVPLEAPGANYNAHDSSLGDLDGDGRYEVVLLWQPNDARDNSQAGVTSNVIIDGLKLDGTRLWRIDLGPNVRAGEHYTQFIVIDSDGDGRAELGVKTAPGTRDSSGEFLSLGPAQADNDGQVFRNGDGYVLDGPEYFTVFDGLTGRELATAPYHTPRGNVGAWGDTYGNRLDRYLAAGAWVDDTGLPSFVMARGYYTRTTLGAYNWRNGELTQLWKFDSNDTPEDSRGEPFTGQGAHSLSVANVDADPEQEIIYGEMTVDNDGSGKCSAGTGHGDALHVGDFIPSRPGVEAFMPAESTNQPQYTLRDPNDCSVLQQSDQSGADVGRAVAADIVPGNPGAEFWATSGNALRSATTGELIGGPQPNSVNFLIWWDADESRELENGTTVTKLGGGNLLNCQQCASNNGTKSVPNLVADLIGDWREEVIWREADNSALRIYTTTDVTERRIYTLMHDPQYRSAISWQNVAYNQPPHPSFHIGNGMAAPPTPDIHTIPRLAPIPSPQ
jgi:rhamnogalacturonan endolyase